MAVEFTTGHASEQGHWYDRTGKPVYEVPKKDGGMRPATLADARKNGWVPGVSAILKCAAAPGLELWKADQLLMAALTLPRGPYVTESDWIKAVRRDSLEQGLAAAARGTEIHAAIEQYYGPDDDYDIPDVVQAVADAVDAKFGWHSWQPERTFGCELGFGGKSDLVSVATDPRDMHEIYEDIVLDFKTKDPWTDNKKLAYDEHAMQLAAYRYGLGRFDAKCANVFVSRVAPWQVYIHVWEEDELQRALYMFKHLLGFWQAQKRYDSGWSWSEGEDESF